jgi:hypothetical protein
MLEIIAEISAEGCVDYIWCHFPCVKPVPRPTEPL